MTKYHESDPGYVPQPDPTWAVLEHPSYTEAHDEDKFELLAELESKGIVSPEVAQAEFTRLMELDTADAPVPLPRRIAKPVLRLIQGGRDNWSRHSDKPDLRPVRHMWRDRRDR